ncbi:MAG: ABC transporter permease [Kiritimatiellae bacterium]|nr:ABC transporter permease [Kiritimatiellia bacterium]
MLIPRLLLSEVRHHAVRLFLAALAVAAAAALIVWSTGTVTTALAQHERYIEHMGGPYALWVVPDQPKPSKKKGFGMQQSVTEEEFVWRIPETVLDALRGDERIRRVDALATVTVQVEVPVRGRRAGGPRPRLIAVGTDAQECPFGLSALEGNWLSEGGNDLPEVVISTGAFLRRAPPEIGEVITLFPEHGPVQVRVAGRIRQPRVVRGFPTLYVRKEVFNQSLCGRLTPECNLALIELKHLEDAPHVAATLAEVLRSADPPCRMEDRSVVLDELQAGVMAQFSRSAPLVLSLAVIATACILITTLSMGVYQRVKSFAMLRAVGLSRFGVFRLVLMEGGLILACGLVLGWGAGYLLLDAMVRRMPELFPNGVVLGSMVFRVSALCAGIGVAGAALFPARRAARMRPLDVLQPGPPKAGRWPRFLLYMGPFFLLPAPILALRLPLPVERRCMLLIAVALPALTVGCILAAPLALKLAERSFSRLLGFLFMVPVPFLRGQLSRDPVRYAGTAITLSLGLGLYISIQTWGASMLAPFVPSPEFPDLIGSFLSAGLTAEEWEKVEEAPGVEPGRCIPLEARQYVLADSTLEHIASNPEYTMNQNNVLLLGVNPERAFGGAHPLFRFRFTEGNAKEAARALAESSTCVVPKMFADQARLHRGDAVQIRVPVYEAGRSVGERIEQLRIVGVVDLNWHLITARSGLRGRNGSPFATMSPVFVSYDRACAWAGAENESIRFVWLNLNDEWRARPPDEAADDLAAYWRKTLQNPLLEIRASHRDAVTAGTVRHAADILEQMARIPRWSLAVLALSILNTMLVGIQTRRFELGVLRAAGLTRFQLARLIAAETLLIGLSACVLSLVFGLESGWCFTGYTRGMMAFGGLPVTFRIPWRLLGTGIGLTLLLSMAAALLPAILAGRKPVTDLLRP